MLIRECEVSQKWWWHCRDAMSPDNSAFLFDLAAQEYRSYKLSSLTRRTLYKAFMGYQCRCRYAAAMSVRLPGRERNDMARSRLNRMAKRVDVFVVACFTTHINQPGKPASIICYLTRNEFTCFLLATRMSVGRLAFLPWSSTKHNSSRSKRGTKIPCSPRAIHHRNN